MKYLILKIRFALHKMTFAGNRHSHFMWFWMDTYYPCDFDVHSKEYAKSHIRIFSQDEHQRNFILAEIEWLKKKNSEKKRFYHNRVGTNQLCRNDWLKYFMKFMKNAQGIIEIFWLLSKIFSVDPWNILAFSPISTRDDVAFMSILVETHSS